MNDKMQEIRDALYLAERNPQKHHEWLSYLLSELDAAQKRIALLDDDKGFFLKELNSALKQLDTAKQENESLRESLAEWQADFNSLKQENALLKDAARASLKALNITEQQLKQAIEALESERDEAMKWDGIGTVNRINKALSLIQEEVNHELKG